MEIKTLSKLDALRRKVKGYSLKKLWRMWNKFDIKSSDDLKLRIVDREIRDRYQNMDSIIGKFV